MGNLLSAQTTAANFGSVQIGTTSTVIPLTFNFTTSDTLASTLVLTEGATGLDYVDAGGDTCTANTTYLAGQSCTVYVEFAPRFSGNRYGAVVLQDSSGNDMAIGLLQGQGVGPQVLFQPGSQSALGSGFSGPTSVAVDGNGDIFVANLSGTALYEMVAVNGTVPATPTIRTIGSGFGGEFFVTLDGGGNVYVADTLNNTVKEIMAVNGSLPNSPTIRTLGSGFSHPAGIAVDSSGNVYVTSIGDNTVKEIVAVGGSIPSSPVIKQLGSGFLEPIGIAVDPSGDIFIADSGHNAIREIPAGTSILTTVGGSFASPYLLALDGNNNLYVADYGDNTVREVEAVNGAIPASPTVQVLGSGFKNPAAVALDGPGNVYVADFGNGRVVKLDFADPPSLNFATTAVGSTSADSPQTIAVLNAGNAPLTFPVPAVGTNPNISTNFALNSSGTSACPVLNSGAPQPATLAPGASCQLAISFTPTVAGTLSGALVLTDSNLNAPAPNYTSQTIQLNGTAAGPSFTLGTSAPSVPLNQGGTATETIIVTAQNGFTGSVSLAISGLPSGVTASFAPNPTTGSSVLTLTASSAAPVTSSQPVTITGTSGTLTVSTTFRLTVTPPPDFSFSTSFTSGQILEGGSGSLTIYSNYMYGFNSAIALSASGLPAGVSITFSPSTIPAPGYGTSIATLVVSTGTVPGVYPITITGIGGGITHSVTYTLTVPTPDFNVYVNPASAYQGGNSSFFIQCVGSNGFSSAITFSLSGQPAGVSYTPLSLPAPGNGEGYINLSVAATTAPGTYPITVVAAGGGVTHYVTTSLVVRVPPDFSLIASPANLTVYQGANTTSTITGTIAGSFNATVSLNTSGGIPFGINPSFSPQTISLPGSDSSTLTIGVAPFVPPGTYTVYISGIGGNVAHPQAASIQLTVLQTPSFGAVNVGSAAPTIPFTFAFNSPTTLGAISVVTQGATGQDFMDAGTGSCAANTAYNQGQICTIDISFSPIIPGSRYGAAIVKDTNGNVIATDYIHGTGVGPQLNFLDGTPIAIKTSSLENPGGLAVDSSGIVYIADTKNNRVLKENLTGNSYFESTVASDLLQPAGVAIDGAGNIYIADTNNDRVLRETPIANGYSESVVASQFGYPLAIAIDSKGDVYFSNYNSVYEFFSAGGTYPGLPNNWGGFTNPSGLAVDGSGNVFVADTGNNAVKEIPQSGPVTTLLSGLSSPSGVTLDAEGNLYVSDTGNNRVLEITKASGYTAVTTMPGAYSAPNGLAVSGTGNLYVANSGNNLVTMQDFADPPSLTFANTADGATSADSPQTITIQNNGNAPLTFPVPASGNNPSIGPDFTLNENAPNACPVVTSGSSAAGTLAPGATCALAISFAPTTGGALNESLVLTDNNLNASSPAYATQSITLSGTGIATPTITWSTPAAITYGTALSATQLNATANVPGTFSYSPAAGTILSAGTQTITVTFTPIDTTDYSTATTTVTLTVNPATPTISWTTPAPITYGTALGSAQLNASSTVAGTFAYSPAAGTVLTAGTQTLTATFTPTDTTDYTTATATVVLTVNQATPTVAWSTPAAITYGTALSSAQLNASATVSGTFSYSPAAGTILSAGTQTLTVTFTPTDTTDYTAATATVTLTVNQAAPTITWGAPAAITYGTALGTAQLNATSTVAGTLSYSPAAGTILTAGTHTLAVTLTPTDTTDYTTATAAVTLTVNQAAPTITWAAPAAITYGTALGSAQLNATANVTGTFAYSPAAGTVLAPGTQALTVIFTPTDSTDYTPASASVSLTVVKATPTITWPAPNPIVYGTALSSAQLNAAANVPGTFAYSPAAGTVLRAGVQTLSVTFMPSNSADYNSATATVSLSVMKATPTITWVTPPPINQGTPLGSMQLDARASVAGTFVYSPAAGTVLAAGNQTLTTSFTPTDTADYNATTGSVVLSVKGFTLSASANSLTVTPGRSGADTITVTDFNGFNSSVALSVSGLPPGVTARFGINPTKGSSVLTFTVSRSAAPGTHTVTVKGVSGPSSASITISLTI